MNNSILTTFVDSPISYIITYIVFVLCVITVIKVIFFRENKNKELNIIVNTSKEQGNNIFTEYEIRNKIKKLRKVSKELAQSKTLIKSCLPAIVSTNIVSTNNYKEDSSITLIPSYQSNTNYDKSIVSYPQNLPDRLKAMKKITIYAKNTIPSVHKY